MAFSKERIAAVILLAVFLFASIYAAPRPGTEWDRYNNPCVFEEIKVEVCQRCAKQTKSPIVYPMCCNSEDNVFEWCNKFIHFGRQQ